MTIINEWFKERFPKYRYALKHADPRTQNWFLLWNDPSGVIFLTLCYLLFVYFGPRVMRKREPLRVPSSMLFVYNLGLVAVSLYMLEEILVGVYQSGYSLVCQKLNVSRKPSEMKVTNALWLYYVSKAAEYMDTVFMIIRKRFTQITFLHCFHHSSMLIIWWIVMTWIPGGQAWFGPTLNCLIHVMMYTYYGLSAIPSLRDKLWWKKYITLFQLIQFGIILIHSMQGIVFGCEYPLWGQWLLGGYMIMMLILFINFYFQEYITRSNERKRPKSHLKIDNDEKTTSRQKDSYSVPKTLSLTYFNMASNKRKEPATDDSDVLIIRPLGAGQEVGRSCIYVEFKGKKILLDFGIHPGLSGRAALPFIDNTIEPEELDLLLISHFHLDHCGALPWFLNKTNFKGRCFMTHATKAIYKWLLSDCIRV
ncbi:unnamed protein product, partial [Didymodactylos carnosus]